MLDESAVNSLLSEVPSEVFDAISPLSNKNSQAIFIALLLKKPMRFGELKQLFNVKNSEDINAPLQLLVDAGLVTREAKYFDGIGNHEIAVYSPTFMGKSVMRSLYKSVMMGSDMVQVGNYQKGAGIMGETQTYGQLSLIKGIPPLLGKPIGGSAQETITISGGGQ
jgi:predicted transcriptional regulator